MSRRRLLRTFVRIACTLGTLLALLSVAPNPAFARGHGGFHSSGHGFGGGGHFHHHGRGGFGVFFFGPAWGYYPYDYYPYDYYYPWTPSPAASYAPEAYVERPDLEEEEERSPHWYYCYDPAGYYPTVKECDGDWTPVAPLPPGPADGRLGDGAATPPAH